MSGKGCLSYLLFFIILGLTSWGVFVGCMKINSDKIFPVSADQEQFCLNRTYNATSDWPVGEKTLTLTCWIIRNTDLILYTCSWYIFINIMAWFFMAIDKCLACAFGADEGFEQFGGDSCLRVPEFFLYLLIVIGGIFGLILGVCTCCHKISKKSFMKNVLVCFLVSVIINGIAIGLLYLLSWTKF